MICLELYTLKRLNEVQPSFNSHRKLKTYKSGSVPDFQIKQLRIWVLSLNPVISRWRCFSPHRSKMAHCGSVIQTVVVPVPALFTAAVTNTDRCSDLLARLQLHVDLWARHVIGDVWHGESKVQTVQRRYVDNWRFHSGRRLLCANRDPWGETNASW